MAPPYQPNPDVQAVIDALDVGATRIVAAIDILRREISKQFDQHDSDLRTVIEGVHEQAREIAAALKPVGEAFKQEKEHNG